METVVWKKIVISDPPSKNLYPRQPKLLYLGCTKEKMAWCNFLKL